MAEVQPEARTPKRVNYAGNNSHHSTATTTPPHSANNLTTGGRTQPAKRLYRIEEQKWVTREIASLDFLLGIPLAGEQEIVKTGFQMQRTKQHEDGQHSSEDGGGPMKSKMMNIPATKIKGAWWEKWIPTQHTDTRRHAKNSQDELLELERPTPQADGAMPISYAPGRRLDGDEATRVQIPLSEHAAKLTKQKSIARLSTIREWELQTAHGLGKDPPLLDGRIFFSADSSYPVAIYSCLRYAPKREEAAVRRRKLEAIGGGGTQFIMPNRDWRGISYRALLKRGPEDEEEEAFNRFVRSDEDEKDDASSTSSASSEESHGYEPGLLDDPDVVLGRHRNVMIGNRVTGPIVSSTIQFVDPVILKEELNKQFRERFDGWEPPKRARKYIGARVVQGNYVLRDPTDDGDDHSYDRRRNRQGSVTSMSTIDETPADRTIRIPPSLTLSKVRSLKRQALQAAVNANLNIGTLALSCVYFERLCLDCRVDKSNRRLTFAACILLAAKLNEPNAGLVMRDEQDDDDDVGTRFHSLIKPNKRSGKMFASLLYFFTEGWHLSLKHLFAAEWGVFAALGFSLHSSPSHVAFHFLRLMKTLEWKPMEYLGPDMYAKWQEALKDDDERRLKRERRKEAKRKQKEERILSLHMELESELIRRKNERGEIEQGKGDSDTLESPNGKQENNKRKKLLPERRLSLFNRLVLRKSVSHERLTDNTRELLSKSAHDNALHRRGSDSARLVSSPSMPLLNTERHEEIESSIVIDISDHESVSSSVGISNDGGNFVV